MAHGDAFGARAVNRWACALLERGLGAAGLVPMWAGRAEAWILVDAEARPRELVSALCRACAILDKRRLGGPYSASAGLTCQNAAAISWCTRMSCCCTRSRNSCRPPAM